MTWKIILLWVTTATSNVRTKGGSGIFSSKIDTQTPSLHADGILRAIRLIQNPSLFFYSEVLLSVDVQQMTTGIAAFSPQGEVSIANLLHIVPISKTVPDSFLTSRTKINLRSAGLIQNLLPLRRFSAIKEDTINFTILIFQGIMLPSKWENVGGGFTKLIRLQKKNY